MINTSDVFTQKQEKKHNLKKITVKRSDVFKENETSDELGGKNRKMEVTFRTEAAIRK